jgi:hypothetical protein
VTGKVRKVLPDKAVLILETPSQTAGIYCSFPSKELIASTKAGDQVIIQAEFGEHPKVGTDITLNGCKLRPPK